MAKARPVKKLKKGRKIKRSVRPILHAMDVPVSKAMLDELHLSIKAEFKSIRHDQASIRNDIQSIRYDQSSLRSEIASVREEINAVRAEVASVREEVNAVRAEVASVREDMKALEQRMDAKFEMMRSDFHRVALLIEEQNKRNTIVLEGYDQLYKRMDRLEHSVDTRLKNIEAVVLK